MIIDPDTINNLIFGATVFAAAFTAALWLSLIIWTYRDIQKRARNPLVRLLAALVSALFFFPGVLIYLILRPQQTLEQEYQSTLEEEALLQAIEEFPNCPKCGKRIKEEWLACPACHEIIKKSCRKCGRILDLSWDMCPFCASPVQGARQNTSGLDDPYLTLPVEKFEKQ